MSLDPNFSEAYAHLAQGLNFAGRPDEAIGFAKKAMRLDPHYAPWVAFFLGESYRMLRLCFPPIERPFWSARLAPAYSHRIGNALVGHYPACFPLMGGHSAGVDSEAWELGGRN